jgi:uncharacterized protein (DUF305 family)
MPICSAEEKAAMPGLLNDDQMRELQTSPSASFDDLFVRLMSLHHAGAVSMADRQIGEIGDIRLTLMAHAIRHQQQGEIALLHGRAGFEAVRAAIANMLGNNIAAAGG